MDRIFVDITLSNCSRLVVSIVPDSKIPALLMSTSKRLYFLIVSDIKFSLSLSFVTSAGTTNALFVPHFSATELRLSMLRPLSIRRAPCAANFFAVSAPIPELAPVVVDVSENFLVKKYP